MNTPIDEFGQATGLGGRQTQRHSVMFLATISRPDGPTLDQIKVRNISSSGLMAETGLPLRPGEAVVIGLKGIGPVSGKIVRRTVNRIAVQFDLPIDPMLTRQR